MSESTPPGNASNPFDLLMRFWAPLGVNPLGVNPLGAQSPSAAAAPFPGFAFPTMNPAEIEKRISELRSVETWLALNLEMLRATIQTLEAQKTTLTAFQSMQGNMEAAVRGAVEQATGPLATPTAFGDGIADKFAEASAAPSPRARTTRRRKSP